VKRLALRR